MEALSQNKQCVTLNMADNSAADERGMPPQRLLDFLRQVSHGIAPRGGPRMLRERGEREMVTMGWWPSRYRTSEGGLRSHAPLSWQHCGADDLDAAWQGSSITHLDLRRNRLSDAGCAAIVDALSAAERNGLSKVRARPFWTQLAVKPLQ